MADASTPQPGTTYSFSYVIGIALVGLLFGVLLAWAWFATSTKPGAVATDGNSLSEANIPDLTLGDTSKADETPVVVAGKEDTPTTPSTASLSALVIHDQPAGMLVEVAQVAVTEGQWVVVHEDRDGTLGNVLGAARFIGGARSGAVELLRGTVSGSMYYGVIYADNGDRAFSLDDDTPLRDASGAVSAVTFNAQ